MPQVVIEGYLVMLCTGSPAKPETGLSDSCSLVIYITSPVSGPGASKLMAVFPWEHLRALVSWGASQDVASQLCGTGDRGGCFRIWGWCAELVKPWGCLRLIPGPQASMITQASALIQVSQASLKYYHATKSSPMTPGVHRITSSSLSPTCAALEIWA